MRAFGGHHARNDSRCEHRPFGSFYVATGKTTGDVSRKLDHGSGMRRPVGRFLVADIDHGGPIALVDMTEFAHWPA